MQRGICITHQGRVVRVEFMSKFAPLEPVVIFEPMWANKLIEQKP